ncbi:MAG: hypothetical protein ACI4L6_01365 [Candidatus Onthoplasma sp.]
MNNKKYKRRTKKQKRIDIKHNEKYKNQNKEILSSDLLKLLEECDYKPSGKYIILR